MGVEVLAVASRGQAWVCRAAPGMAFGFVVVSLGLHMACFHGRPPVAAG